MSKKKKSLLEIDISIGKVNADEIISFAKHLAIMLKSGLTISEALNILYGQAEGKLKKIIFRISKSVMSGNSLSSSLSKFPKVFTPIFINTVYVGESSGTLEENLENIAVHLGKDKELANKIKSAMLYPSIVLTLVGVLGLAMAFVVLPKITPLFEGLNIELPLTTRLLIEFSNFIQVYGKESVIGLVVFSIFFFWLVKQKFSRPVTNKILLKIPIIKNIIKSRNISTFCNTLGTLLKSGLNIDEALEITKSTVSNYYYQKSLQGAAEKTKQGVKLSENLKLFKSLYPNLAISMIKIGEKSGRLEETLFYLTSFYEEEVSNSTRRLSTAIEPLLMIFIGLAVGVLAVSIITPIYKITGNVQQ